MKLILSWLVMAACLLSFPEVVKASPYPADMCRQYVSNKDFGSAVVFEVHSGCGRAYVFGYRNRGTLSGRQPQKIDAIVIASCQMNDGSTAQKKSTVTLGKEWQGTGYLSVATQDSFYPSGCGYQRDQWLQVSFSDGNGNWDSNYGQNYSLDLYDLDSSHNAIRTNEINSGIGLESWGHIIDIMKN